MLLAIRRRGNRQACGRETSETTTAGRRRPPRASFASLVRKRQFDKIVPVLRDGGDSRDIAAWLDRDAPEGGGGGRNLETTPFFQLFRAQLPLHLALKHQPPVELVDLLIGCLAPFEKGGRTGVIGAPDLLGRCPLHLAVTHGCDISVIELLLREMSMSPTARLPCDIWGRSPLHWAVARDCAPTSSSVGCFGCSPSTRNSALVKELESRVKIVAAILAAFPGSLQARDREGRTALELGIQHRADGALLYLLGAAAARRIHGPSRCPFEITVNNHNAKNDRRDDSKANAGYGNHRHPRPRGTTPDTSLQGSSLSADLSLLLADPDVPVEIVETRPRRTVDDACSSIGTGGISKQFHRRRPAVSRRDERAVATTGKPTATVFYEQLSI